MNPGFYQWWKNAQKAAEECAGRVGAEYARSRAAGEGARGFSASGGRGGGFGVRRPLRFMAHKLELDDGQVQILAQILAELKTERAQAAVDDQRTLAAIADAMEATAFDEDATRAAVQRRVESAEKLRDAVVKALGRTYAMLKPEQRTRLAYLLRSGGLTI